MGTLASSFATAVAVMCLNPVDQVLCDKVDLIELNHFHDEFGRLVFDQLIFYDWCPLQARYNVRAWRLLKTPAQIPTRHWERKEFVALWHDGDTLRKVIASSLRESWTQYDPELVEREFLPKEKRRDLRKPASKELAKDGPQGGTLRPRQ